MRAGRGRRDRRAHGEDAQPTYEEDAPPTYEEATREDPGIVLEHIFRDSAV
jgi:hypothetical protein